LLIAWYAREPEERKWKNLCKNAFFAEDRVRTPWAPGFHALYVEARDLFIMTAILFAILAKDPANLLTACHVHAVWVKALKTNQNEKE